MPLTPQITLTINLLDYSNNQSGSATAPAYVRLQLCGFAGTLPRIPGTGFLGTINSGPTMIPYVGTALSIPLFGNDVITPAGTFYTITILDANRQVIQAGSYQLTGSGTFDLSTLAQYQPPNPPLNAPNPVLLNPTGTQTINGSLILTGSLTVEGTFSGGLGFNSATISYSATPVFNATGVNRFSITLTGNVTSSTFTNGGEGPYIFEIVQDATGGRTFVWPANVVGGGTPDPTPHYVSTQMFWYDGVKLRAMGPMLSYSS